MYGPLPGRHQSVPRGELFCLVLAVAQSRGPMAFVTDNEEVCRGFWADLCLAPMGPNADLWRNLRDAIQATDRHP
eukprot:4557018-Pyramimonas_sp.AAC.1